MSDDDVAEHVCRSECEYCDKCNKCLFDSIDIEEDMICDECMDHLCSFCAQTKGGQDEAEDVYRCQHCWDIKVKKYIEQHHSKTNGYGNVVVSMVIKHPNDTFETVTF